MPYINIEDFRYGMDRRRARAVGKPGTLWTLKNGHITRGGDIEGRKAFVSAYTLPSGTSGGAELRGQLYTFGSADLAASIPVGVQYQRLISKSGTATLTKILDVKPFAGKLYAIGEYDDGNIFHYYDGSRVVDWDNAAEISAIRVAEALADKIATDTSITALAFGQSIAITARVAGTPFTISGSAVNGAADNTQSLTITETQANRAAVAETLATATIKVTGGTAADRFQSILINGVSELITNDVFWVASNVNTANLLAIEINNGTAMHSYSASVISDTVTISALPGTGATPNTYPVDITYTSTVTAAATLTGGVTAVTPVTQAETVVIGGVIDGADTFTITVNGTAYKITGLGAGMGTSLMIHQHRVFSPAGSLWRYCKLDTPTVWDPLAVGSDAGYLNVASESEGNDDLQVGARYQRYAAIFGKTFVTVYSLDTDPANFAIFDTADATGTFSPGSVVRYGNNDVFYLDHIGIRSLRARDASNAPFVTDVGNEIDAFVQEFIDTLTPRQVRDALAVIEPRDGRYWLALGTRIFVLSSFPGDQISAWSYYDPGFTVTAFIRIGKQIYVRAGDAFYLYGGPNGTSYPAKDAAPVEIGTPFLNGETPETPKTVNSFDITSVNQWDVEALYDPNDETLTIDIGSVIGVTANGMNVGIGLANDVAMVALKLVCSQGGACTLSSLQLNYGVA